MSRALSVKTSVFLRRTCHEQKYFVAKNKVAMEAPGSFFFKTGSVSKLGCFDGFLKRFESLGSEWNWKVTQTGESKESPLKTFDPGTPRDIGTPETARCAPASDSPAAARRRRAAAQRPPLRKRRSLAKAVRRPSEKPGEMRKDFADMSLNQNLVQKW